MAGRTMLQTRKADTAKTLCKMKLLNLVGSPDEDAAARKLRCRVLFIAGA
jgi:hypothetical protein